jgi:hypothetical protein
MQLRSVGCRHSNFLIEVKIFSRGRLGYLWARSKLAHSAKECSAREFGNQQSYLAVSLKRKRIE